MRVRPTTVAELLSTHDYAELPTNRDLLLQTLLHLPRLAANDGTISEPLAMAEISRLRELRAAELAPLAELATPPVTVPALNDLRIDVIGAVRAEPILGHFHYLRSFRDDSVTVAALYGQRVVGLCSVSPLDVAAVVAELPIDSPQEGAVISRVFAFDWAPRNIISYMLARVEQSRVLAEARILLTYLNPNLGFTGASYRAANWRPLGVEIGTRYAYMNRRYITDRRLLKMPRTERVAVEYSRMALQPLVLYGRYRDRGLRRFERRRFVVAREDA